MRTATSATTRPPKEYDSALESGFADRFSKLQTPWTLEREVDLVPIPGGVIIPDFRLVHRGRAQRAAGDRGLLAARLPDEEV